MGRLDWDRILSTTHNIRVEVNLLDYRGRDVMLSDGKTPIPPLRVEKLQWRSDATTRPNHSGTITLPLRDVSAAMAWEPKRSDFPLTPFGNMLEIWLQVQDSEQRNSEDCRLGFVLIETVTMDRPANTITVTFVDMTDIWSNSRIHKPMPQENQTGRSDREWVVSMIDGAQPGMLRRNDDGSLRDETGIDIAQLGLVRNNNKVNKTAKWSAGTTRMEIVDELLRRQDDPLWCYMGRNGRLRIDKARLLDIVAPPEGDRRHPLKTGPGGTVMAVRSSVTRKDAYNQSSTWNTDARKGKQNYHVTHYYKKGPMRVSRVGHRNVLVTTDKETGTGQIDTANKELLLAGGGLRRTVEVTAIANPYFIIGDTLELTVNGNREDFIIRSVEITLPEAIMRVEGTAWTAAESEDYVSKLRSGSVADPDPPEDTGGNANFKGGRYPSSHKFNAEVSALDNSMGTPTSVKNTAAAYAAIAAEFPKITRAGGYRSDAGFKYPWHEAGIAIDIMSPGSSFYAGGSQEDYMNNIVRYFIKYQKVFAVSYIQWRQRMWSQGNGWGGLSYGSSYYMSDRGSVTANHRDHIHLQLHGYTSVPRLPYPPRQGTYWNQKSGRIAAAQHLAIEQDYDAPETYGIELSP